MKERRKISFLGDIVIILVIVIFVFLFMRQFEKNTINEIQEVNKEFNVSGIILIPSNTNEYIIRLSQVSNNEITPVLIDFVKLNQEISIIENLIFRGAIVREDCMSRDLKLRINSAYLKIVKLQRDFNEIKHYEQLNINNYISQLNALNKKYLIYRNDSEKIPVC